MKQKNDKLNEMHQKERPLKGLKEMMGKHKVMFKENPKNERMSKKKIKSFAEMRKWDAELEKIDREENVIKNSLKELNMRISDAISKRSGPKSNTQSNDSINIKEQRKINASMIKIDQIVKKSRVLKDFPKSIVKKQ